MTRSRPLFPLDTYDRPHPWFTGRGVRRIEVPSAPYSSVIRCAVCDDPVHRYDPADQRPLEEIAADAEVACRSHLVARHPFRLTLYDVFGWTWQIT